MIRRRLLILGLAAVTILAFLPVLRNGFVDWDDVRMFVENRDYRGLGPSALRFHWTTTWLGEYMPVTWMSYGLDYLAWGLDPRGYHLQSLVWHVAASLAVYALARRLYRAAAGAWDPVALELGACVAALVFAVHPLRVEPVAWASARGTLVGGVFLLLATLAYVAGAARAGRRPMSRGWLAASAGLLLLGCLARATGVVLPGVLVVLDVYPLRRLGGGPGLWLGPPARRVWREKLLLLAPALIVAPLAFRARFLSADPARPEHYDAVARILVLGYGWAFYAWETLVPMQLAPVYEAPLALRTMAGELTAGAVLVVIVTALLVALRRRWPAGLAAWIAYLLLVLPLSGLAPAGLLHLAADRYTYVATVPWALLAGAAVAAVWVAGGAGRVRAPVAVLCLWLTAAVLAGWGWLTWRQVGVWRDSATLWRHAVAVQPGSAVAHANLGVVLERDGELDAAVAEYRQAVGIWPGYGPLRVRLGRALARQGRLVEAVRELRAAVAAGPDDPVAHLALGVALTSRGDLDGAIAAYRTALRLDAASALAHYHLGVALAAVGRSDEAAGHYRRALELAPDFTEARERLDEGPAPGGS